MQGDTELSIIYNLPEDIRLGAVITAIKLRFLESPPSPIPWLRVY